MTMNRASPTRSSTIGIRVNTIDIGWTNTPREHVRADPGPRPPRELAREASAKPPFGRLIEPDGVRRASPS